MGDDKYVFKIL